MEHWYPRPLSPIIISDHFYGGQIKASNILPFAIAPMTTQIGSADSGTTSDGFATFSAVYDMHTLRQPMGR